MKTKLSELQFADFLTFCKSRRENCPNITDKHLLVMFEKLSNGNLACEGKNYRLTYNGETLGTAQPDTTEFKEQQIEFLFVHVWAETAWVMRCLDKPEWEVLPVNKYGRAFVKQFKEYK